MERVGHPLWGFLEDLQQALPRVLLRVLGIQGPQPFLAPLFYLGVPIPKCPHFLVEEEGTEQVHKLLQAVQLGKATSNKLHARHYQPLDVLHRPQEQQSYSLLVLRFLQ